ncbi:MAG: PGDYG domain-containing protein [Pseudomonadota bacterium]
MSADARRVRARKRSYPVQVHFAERDCAVATLEGSVQAHTGDAIVTGTKGEQWPVARPHFEARYRAVAPTVPGSDGTYLSLPIEVLAIPMAQPFAVELAQGRARLQGAAGDWLVDYGDGSLGIVAPAIFGATYDILESN